MASRRHCRSRDVFCLTAALWISPAWLMAQARPAPLQGVKEVSVRAYIVAPAGALPAGLTEARLQTIAELKLRSWDLRVVTEDEKTPGIRPRVDLDLTLVETRSVQKLVGYAFHTRLTVTEPGTSLRNGAAVTTELWSHSFLTVSDAKSVTADAERAAGELLDQFINEWLRTRR